MTASQKKKIYEVLSQQELNLTDFSEKKVPIEDGLIASQLYHSPTGLYFQFSYNEMFEGLEAGPWQVIHTPGGNYRPIASHLGFISTWQHVISLLKDWIYLLKQEIDSQSFIDKMLTHQINLKDFSYQSEAIEEPFTEQEKTVIRAHLNSFIDDIKKLDFSQSEIKEINQKVDYLIDRLDKNYSKIDWINIFISIILATVTSEGLEIVKSPDFIENIKSLFHLITGGSFLD